MRYILFFVVIFWLTPDSSAQVKIKNNGYVGIGTLDPLVRLHVMGDGIFQNNFYQTLRILPGNPGVEIGASTSRIDFWYAGEGYNRLFAKSFTKMSDSCLKCNFQGR